MKIGYLIPAMLGASQGCEAPFLYAERIGVQQNREKGMVIHEVL